MNPDTHAETDTCPYCGHSYGGVATDEQIDQHLLSCPGDCTCGASNDPGHLAHEGSCPFAMYQKEP